MFATALKMKEDTPEIVGFVWFQVELIHKFGQAMVIHQFQR